MIFLNSVIFIIAIIFLILFCIFLYKGSNIYELLVYSNVNFIYDKIEKDFYKSLNKYNEIQNLNFAITNNYIYKTSSANLNYNALLNQFYITNNKHKPMLDLDKDNNKIIPLISNLKSKFDYQAFDVKSKI